MLLSPEPWSQAAKLQTICLSLVAAHSAVSLVVDCANMQVPTSVRTIESVIDVPGWAPITPYLNMANSVPTSQVLFESKTKASFR